MRYEVHPLAAIFPEIEGQAFQTLVEDIKERGQQEPVWLFENKILDGKNRARACELLGKEPLIRPYTGDDPVGFVLSANLHRRHLDESQRAMIGARLTTLTLGANQHTKGISIDVASKLLSVGRASIDRARKVLGTGDVKLIESVDKGKVSVSNAAKGKGKKRTPPTPAGEYDKLEEKLIDKLKELDPSEAKDHADKTIAALNDTVADIVNIAKRAATKAAKLGAVVPPSQA